jgi:hypothetical protein
LSITCTASPDAIQVGQTLITAEDGDWLAGSLALRNTAEAALMVRTGDVDNPGFGWPLNFNRFYGNRFFQLLRRERVLAANRQGVFLDCLPRALGLVWIPRRLAE